MEIENEESRKREVRFQSLDLGVVPLLLGLQVWVNSPLGSVQDSGMPPIMATSMGNMMILHDGIVVAPEKSQIDHSGH